MEIGVLYLRRATRLPVEIYNRENMDYALSNKLVYSHWYSSKVPFIEIPFTKSCNRHPGTDLYFELQQVREQVNIQSFGTAALLYDRRCCHT